MFDLFKSWIKNDMQKVLDAKLAFFTTVILAFCLAYGAAFWRYDTVVDNYKSALKAQGERHKMELLKKCQLSLLPKLVTISSNEIILSGTGTYLVDTENTANSNDLKKIYGLSEGDKVTLKAADNDRTIVIKKGHYLKMPANFSLNNENDFIILESKGSNVCAEVHRQNNGD